MHRTVRMLGILLQLQKGSTTIGALADHYECSRKSIQRDIAALVELQIPVSSTSGPNGGVALDPAWSLSPINLTAEEIETTVLALEHASYLPAAELTLAKIRTASKPPHFDKVANDPGRPQVVRSTSAEMPEGVERIRNVMQRQMWCRIDYSGGSNPGWRLILPQELHVLEGKWYLHAIDERSRSFRNFRADRIRDLTPALAPADAESIVAEATAKPAYGAEHHPEVEVQLTDVGIRFCRDHNHFHRHIEGDILRFRCPPGDLNYVAREILRMGTDATIIAPPELRDWAKRIVEELDKHLANDQDDTVS